MNTFRPSRNQGHAQLKSSYQFFSQSLPHPYLTTLMSKSRQFSRNLSRFLSRTSSPVYIVGQSSAADRFALQVNYANEAMLEWLKVSADEILNKRLVYSSQPLDDPVEQKLRGLCPAPELLAATSKLSSEQEGRESIRSKNFDVFIQSGSGESQFRQATGSILDSGKLDSPEILVVCDGAVFSTPARTDSFIPVEMHGQLHVAMTKIASTQGDKFNSRSLIGKSPFVTGIRKKFQAAVESTASVLIVGPLGSGKEHLARSIITERIRAGETKHGESKRGAGTALPPLVIDCPVADPELIQRSLRERRRPTTGQPMQTHLLLLDIDGLSESAQSELTGFLELPGSVFTMTATAQTSPTELAERNRFHPALAHSINTLTIELPSLSARAEDIPLLAQAFLEQQNVIAANAKSPTLASSNNATRPNGRQLGGFSPLAMQMLWDFDWPGNLNQLAGVVRESAVAATGGLIEAHDLPESFRGALRARELEKPEEVSISLVDYLADIEAELIARAMQQAGGNKSRAAKLLGISRPKLLRRLQSNNDDPEKEMLDSSAFEEADD